MKGKVKAAKQANYLAAQSLEEQKSSSAQMQQIALASAENERIQGEANNALLREQSAQSAKLLETLGKNNVATTFIEDERLQKKKRPRGMSFLRAMSPSGLGTGQGSATLG